MCRSCPSWLTRRIWRAFRCSSLPISRIWPQHHRPARSPRGSTCTRIGTASGRFRPALLFLAREFRSDLTLIYWFLPHMESNWQQMLCMSLLYSLGPQSIETETLFLSVKSLTWLIWWFCVVFHAWIVWIIFFCLHFSIRMGWTGFVTTLWIRRSESSSQPKPIGVKQCRDHIREFLKNIYVSCNISRLHL